jgi:7,8-dihydro-6-hydroxymethylpterin dimethyltransferase
MMSNSITQSTDAISSTKCDEPSPIIKREILSTTESVCPACLQKIPANRVLIGGDVYLEKECPKHGTFQTVIWRASPDYTDWGRPKLPSFPKNPQTEIVKGCPYDCGLCGSHRQHPCCVLLDVTQRCDLSCSFCFACAGGKEKDKDPSLEKIGGWYRKLMDAGGPFNIQLSGGEPCMRDDLPEIITLGKSLGFSFFQVNTNGVRLSTDLEYFQRLKDAGLCTVYLQFDGTQDGIYHKMRGRKLLEHKLQVIENSRKLGVGVVLVPTLVPGVNIDNIGAILQLAIEHSPTVRGVHFQPVSYFGRYPQAPQDSNRITLPEVMCAIEKQTNGKIKKESFIPPGAENEHCSFHAKFVIMENGALKAFTTQETCSCSSSQPQIAADGSRKSRLITARHWSAPKIESTEVQSLALGGWDMFLERAKTHTFSISGMAFQDAWNFDLERVQGCCIIQVSPEGLLIPFCVYNLTNQEGKSLYRPI